MINRNGMKRRKVLEKLGRQRSGERKDKERERKKSGKK